MALLTILLSKIWELTQGVWKIKGRKFIAHSGLWSLRTFLVCILWCLLRRSHFKCIDSYHKVCIKKWYSQKIFFLIWNLFQQYVSLISYQSGRNALSAAFWISFAFVNQDIKNFFSSNCTIFKNPSVDLGLNEVPCIVVYVFVWLWKINVHCMGEYYDTKVQGATNNFSFFIPLYHNIYFKSSICILNAIS